MLSTVRVDVWLVVFIFRSLQRAQDDDNGESRWVAVRDCEGACALAKQKQNAHTRSQKRALNESTVREMRSTCLRKDVRGEARTRGGGEGVERERWDN
jgi:hypothetical protein